MCHQNGMTSGIAHIRNRWSNGNSTAAVTTKVIKTRNITMKDGSSLTFLSLEVNSALLLHQSKDRGSRNKTTKAKGKAAILDTVVMVHMTERPLMIARVRNASMDNHHHLGTLAVAVMDLVPSGDAI